MHTLSVTFRCGEKGKNLYFTCRWMCLFSKRERYGMIGERNKRILLIRKGDTYAAQSV